MTSPGSPPSDVTPTAHVAQSITGGPINAALAAQLDELLAQRNSTTIPSGFFAWWVIRFFQTAWPTFPR